jgi:hypothetical protein
MSTKGGGRSYGRRTAGSGKRAGSGTTRASDRTVQAGTSLPRGRAVTRSGRSVGSRRRNVSGRDGGYGILFSILRPGSSLSHVSGVRMASISLDCGHPGASIFAKTPKSRQFRPFRSNVRTPAISRSAIAGPVSGGIKVGLTPARFLPIGFVIPFFESVSRESKRIGRKAVMYWASPSLSAAEGSAIHGRRPLSII